MNHDMHNQGDMADRVDREISSRNVSMRPRAYFMARSALRIAGVLALVAGALFVASIILFSLRSSGADALPGFGMRGLGALIAVFPWILLGAATALAVLGALVAWMLPSGHRHSFAGTFGIILGVVIAGAIIAPLTPFHERALRSVREGTGPVWGGLYRGGMMHDASYVYQGVVSATTPDSFDLAIESGEVVHILISSSTRARRGVMPHVGDQVIVGGDLVNGVIEAFGIRVVSDEEDTQRRGMDQ